MEKSERQKVLKRKGGLDLISKMPDAILVLILSRLPYTEEQIRSSILSRRWRYLWTAIPSIRLHFGSRDKLKKSEFKEFTYWVLASKTVDLDIFRLRCHNHYRASTIWRWVHLAVMRNIKQLDLSFLIKKETEVIPLPRYLVNRDSLESDDAACDLSLPNLKTMLLRTTMEAFTVDELIQILKYCPKLENLTLIIRKDFDEEYEWVDEAETRRIWTSDVKRVEFFEFSGEKPKLDIEWCENELDLFLFFSWILNGNIKL
ncbi:hypothetical protein LXL04_003227 [Taraxacum kok-saghyz]